MKVSAGIPNETPLLLPPSVSVRPDHVVEDPRPVRVEVGRFDLVDLALHGVQVVVVRNEVAGPKVVRVAPRRTGIQVDRDAPPAVGIVRPR